jgi:Holliday junction resolvasome RuvABC ATP-dependent DNA helicase subunit
MIPRKALEFARYVTLYKNMHDEKSWVEVAKEVAEHEGIDEYGMHESNLKVLNFLNENGCIAIKRLEYMLGKKTEEIEKYILPSLVCGQDGCPLVSITKSGLKITDKGILELKKRQKTFV